MLRLPTSVTVLNRLLEVTARDRDHACRAPRLARFVVTRAQSARHQNRYRSVRAGRACRGQAGGPAAGGAGALCRPRRNRRPIADYQSELGPTLLRGAAWPVRADWLGSGQDWTGRGVEGRACPVVL